MPATLNLLHDPPTPTSVERKPSGDLPQLLRMEEAARYLAITRVRAYELAKQGILPVVRLGRQLRVAETALRTFIEQGGSSGACKQARR
jgi:excisionase family DNA binding protein